MLFMFFWMCACVFGGLIRFESCFYILRLLGDVVVCLSLFGCLFVPPGGWFVDLFVSKSSI